MPTPAAAAAGRSRLPIAILVGVVAALAIGALGLWYLFGGSAPAAVSLATASPAAGTQSAAVAATAPAAPASAAAGTGTSPATAGGLDGTWSVDATTGSFSDFTSSFVGYRVDEQLANVGATTAVGRTPRVSGSLTLAGASITAVKITADLSTLQSDKPMRDGQLHRQALETDQFPSATFELTRPIALDAGPADGATISATATGNLTLHGVTREVSIPIQAKLAGGTVTVVGTLPVRFADFGINPPQSMMVLSVADTGTMELQLLFTKG